MKIILYLPVNTNKPKFVTFLVCVCTTASFVAQMLYSENVSKWDAILAQVTKQWIAKDIITSYGSQPESVKITIHWFGKYYWEIFLMESELAAPKKQCLIIML